MDRAFPREPDEPTCPICRQARTAEFFRLDAAPVFCNVTYPDRRASLRAARGDIRLRVCRGCGYIFNAAFDPERVRYAPGYGNPLHHSRRFRRYARKLAARVIRELDLKGRRIIEIGCGDGYFLSLLCRMGANTGVGFDPSHTGRNAPGGGERLTFRREFYGPSHADMPVDFICCRHVLEHIPDPLRFLRGLRRNVGGRSHVRLYFEVPDTLHLIDGSGMWDVLYEHCGYYLDAALRRVLQRAGFEPVATWSAYEGQFLAAIARPGVGPAQPHAGPVLAEDVCAWLRTFADRFARQLDAWRQRLAALRQDGRRVALWGAGSKGVTLLNALADSRQLVSCVVDVNRHKQHRHVAGTGHRIVPPEALRAYAPVTVVIMNPIYRAEIRRTLAQLEVRADIVTIRDSRPVILAADRPQPRMAAAGLSPCPRPPRK